MKKLTIILSVSLFFIISIYSCKTSSSNPSYYIEQDQKNSVAYLFAAGTSQGKNPTDIICRFEASLPLKRSSSNYYKIDLDQFNDAVYITEDKLLENKYAQKFLKYMDSSDTFTIKTLTKDEENKIYPLFDEAKKLLENGGFDSSIGDPAIVCYSILNDNQNTNYFITTRSDFFPFALYNEQGTQLFELNSPNVKMWQDRVTGMYWTRGNNLNAFDTLDSAKSYCKSLEITKSKGSWRIPTVKDFYDASEYPSEMFGNYCLKERYGKFCDYIFNTEFWVSTEDGQNISKSDFSKKHPSPRYPMLTNLTYEENSPAQIRYGHVSGGVIIAPNFITNPIGSERRVLCVHD